MSGERVRVVSFLGLGNRQSLPEDRYVACRHRFGRGADLFVSDVATPLHDLGTWEWLRVHRGLAPDDITVELLGTQLVADHWVQEGHLARLVAASGLGETYDCTPRLGFTLLEDGDDRALWSVFETVRAALNPTPHTLTLGPQQFTERGPPTEIIVDITHGFRSQPFLAAAVLVYVASQFKRAAREAGPDAPPAPRLRILYAAFEKNDKGSPPLTPVWELTRFLDVLAWDGALDDLMRHGRGDELQSLLTGFREDRIASTSDPQGRATAGTALAPLAKLATATRSFADALTTVRAADVTHTRAAALLGAMSGAEKTIGEELPVLRESFEALTRWCEPLQSERLVSPVGLAASLALASRYARLERYSELSALLRETLITAFTVATRNSQEWRQPGSGQAFRMQRREDEHRLNVLAKDARARKLGELIDPRVAELAAALVPLIDVRNDMQHAGFNGQPESAANLRRQLGALLARATTAIETFYAPLEGPIDLTAVWAALEVETRPTRFDFVNCSNHPSALWSGPQREAARALGADRIVDLPFPAVPVTATEGDIATLADDLVASLVAEGSPLAVHVAGEFTLTFAVVDRLLKHGVPAYAASAERRVEERVDANGHTVKESLFVFCGWRAYARI